MANALEVTVKGFDELSKRLSSMQDKILNDVDDILNVSAQNIAADAQIAAPVDEGLLRQQISADTATKFEKTIAVRVFYAAYVEFGTGAYAAQYVSSLPNEWQAFANLFRGPTGQPFDSFLLALQEWVRRKGIGTGKDYKQIAYRIAIKILRNGIRPQPYLYPAFRDESPKLLKNITNLLNSF